MTDERDFEVTEEEPKIKLKDSTVPPTTLEKAGSAVKNVLSLFKKRGPSQKEPIKINPKVILAVLGVLCAVLFVLTYLDAKFASPIRKIASQVVVPAQNGVNNVGLWISNQIDVFKSKEKLIEENESLKKKLDSLTAENTQLMQKENELDRLRSLLDLKTVYSAYDTIAAQVIAKDSTKWFSNFTINKGTNDGVAKDMNVVADGGLVGYISEAGPNYSVIRTIIDNNSNASAMFEKSSELCIVTGNLTLMEDNLIEFSNVSFLVEIDINDAVITSDVSSKYLPGLLIGYVAECHLDDNDLTQSGYVSPVVDFSNLHEVLIITNVKEITDEEPTD